MAYFSFDTRWRVVSGAFLTQALVIGGVFSYGVFFTVLEEEFGWSRTLLSLSSSIAFLVMGVTAVVIGRLNDQFGPRWVLSVTGLICGLGFILMSMMTMPWHLLLYFGLFVGIGLSAHDVATLSTVASWFERRRGAITGLVKTGTACGQILMPMLATLLIASVGWRDALWVMGMVISLGLLSAAQCMRKPDQKPTQAGERVSEKLNGVSFRVATRSPTLWMLCAIQFCFLPTLITIPLHIVAHAKDLGMTIQSATMVLSALGASSIMGRLIVGFLFDRVGGKLTLRACLIVLAASLISLLLIEQAYWLYVFAFFYGCAHGGLFTVVSPTIAEYFGMQAHGAIFGVIVLFGTLGAASGPLLAGMVFDYYGSYDLAVQILALLVGAALVVTAWLKPLITLVTKE